MNDRNRNRLFDEWAKKIAGDRWDEEKYNWATEEALRACEDLDYQAENEQISSCGGVFLIKPRSAPPGDVIVRRNQGGHN